MKKRLLIGVIMTECQINFQVDILRGIISQSFKANCDLVILAPLHNFFVVNPHKQAEKEILKLINSQRFDGFLYDRNTIYDEDIRLMTDNLLLATGKPVMLLDSQEHKVFESTAIDDCTAFEQITDHLIDVHGCKKIYCLTGPKKMFVSEERLEGFLNSMKKHGLTAGKDACFYGDFWKNAAEELAAKIIKGEIDRPDAVVCGNDVSAIALTDSLMRGGISVPEDIAVTGYDASEEAARNVPTIASYRRPNFQLGAEAFRRIYRMITGKICRKVQNDNGNFIPSRSCGCKNPPLKPASRSARMLKNYENDILHRDMLFDITNTSTPEEFADRLDNYTYYLYKMRHMCICLTKKYIDCKNGRFSDSLTFETGDEMKIILSKEGFRRRFDMIRHFSSEDILPGFDEERSYPLAYFITPLHFNENFFGYSAISFGKLPMSFSELYLHWIKYINVALEQVRIKSILDKTISKASHAMLYDESTGLLNKTGIKARFSENIANFRRHSSKVEFIRIQLSGLNDAQYQGDDDKCARITAAFAGFIRECIKEDEICGIWSVYSFAVITHRENRSEELFRYISEKVRNSRFSENDNCNINFTIGTDVQPLSAEVSPNACLHKAALNRIHSYTVTETTENPQYEKLCILRGRIMKNPELPWNVNDIAAELYLSKSYLQKMYKHYFGKSIIMDMIDFRLEKAKNLLSASDMTVTEISMECGYSSYNYFVRQFKTAEGMSPTEYREK